MRFKDLFISSGHIDEIRAIREALDLGQEFARHSPYSMAEALLEFLQSLRFAFTSCFYFPCILTSQIHTLLYLLSTPIIPDFLLPPGEIDPQNIRVRKRILTFFFFTSFFLSFLISLGLVDFWKDSLR